LTVIYILHATCFASSSVLCVQGGAAQQASLLSVEVTDRVRRAAMRMDSDLEAASAIGEDAVRLLRAHAASGVGGCGAHARAWREHVRGVRGRVQSALDAAAAERDMCRLCAAQSSEENA